MRPIAVLGAGAFGTALAIAFASTGRPVLLWARDATQVAAMRAERQNSRYLAHIRFPKALKPIDDLHKLPMDALQVLAVPAQQTGAFIEQWDQILPDAPLVLTGKGIDQASAALQSQVAANIAPARRLAVLSGPGFAAEIAQGLPTALSLGCADPVLGAQLQDRLHTPVLRLYRTTDIIGVQLGGALKNVVALACGMCDGAGLGDSARAALMTRGFAEIARLGKALGAEAETLTGLSGLGDLALTCASDHSRNFAAGRDLGRIGRVTLGTTIEGMATAHAVLGLAANHEIEMPIAEAVTHVLDGTLSISEVMTRLLSRPQRAET
ncbi:NAD(P)H-dependent glycerol-3-phosphate dehydrogenase [Halovulum sp. GXIMD14793]